IINIFSWHSNWTVKVAENNGPYKIMSTNIKEYDRAAYDYLFGDEKPVYRPFAEPENNNDHMFNYHPSDTCRFINVLATDGYGNTYTGTINRD
ncbi:MAG: calcineurin-like phosphoesterase C-terminal domain-containing protein, partial [Niabella sp.]